MSSYLGFDGSAGQAEEQTALLPADRQPMRPLMDPEEVTKIAIRLKYQIEQVISCELEEAIIIKPHSPIITQKVIQTAKDAGGKKYKDCIVYCLLIVRGWFKKQSKNEPWDAELYDARVAAADVIAKRIIESEEDQDHLMQDVLLQRFAICVNGEQAHNSNVIERAVDVHCLLVITSSGYQKCINYVWLGWLCQDDSTPSRFVRYENETNTDLWAHWDPARMRVPRYQNALQMALSILFLVLYTIAINTINQEGDIDVIEAFLYLFTLGFVTDEAVKLWKAGRNYLGFWNVFNNTLYILLTASFVLRMIALSHHNMTPEGSHYNVLSYDFLAFSAPFFWLRVLLYLDTYRFFGAMLVVVKVMMNESIIFFALLSVLLLGFLQAFIGLDDADSEEDSTSFVFKALVNAIMTSPDFDGFETFSHPFGLILYYIYTFITMVVLLNILVALYSSAYSDVTEDATDEYMALFAQKAIQFVRAPDENVFIPPFNLLEFFLLILPFSWWLPAPHYSRLADTIMGILYAPLLAVISVLECRAARRVRFNRRRGQEDEDTTEEWEVLGWEVRDEDESWVERVEGTVPDVAGSVDGKVEKMAEEMRGLRKTVEELVKLVGESGRSANGLGNGTAPGKENANAGE